MQLKLKKEGKTIDTQKNGRKQRGEALTSFLARSCIKSSMRRTLWLCMSFSLCVLGSFSNSLTINLSKRSMSSWYCRVCSSKVLAIVEAITLYRERGLEISNVTITAVLLLYLELLIREIMIRYLYLLEGKWRI